MPAKEVVMPHAAPDRDNPRLDVVAPKDNRTNAYAEGSVSTPAPNATAQHHNPYQATVMAATVRATQHQKSCPRTPCNHPRL